MNDSAWDAQTSREGALASLLQDLFSTEELSRLIAHEFGDRVHAAISWDRPRATVVEQVVRGLRKRGLVRQLFDALRRERAFRRSDIEPVAELWTAVAFQSAPVCQSQSHASSGTSARSLGAFLLGAAAAVGGSFAVLSLASPTEEAHELVPVSEQEERPSYEADRASEKVDEGSRHRKDRDACCRTCGMTTKACGDSCIARDKQCHKGPGGCACS